MTDESVPTAVFDDRANRNAVVREKLLDAQTPGFIAEFDPDEAEHAGAFVEDALGEDEAYASSPDLPAALVAMQNPVRVALTLAKAMLEAGSPHETRWLLPASMLAAGLILHTSMDDGPITASAVAAMLSLPAESLAEVWSQMVSSSHEDERARQFIQSVGTDMTAMGDVETAAVVLTARQRLAASAGE